MLQYIVTRNKDSLVDTEDNLGYFDFFSSVLLTCTPYELYYDWARDISVHEEKFSLQLLGM
jgi:hypothetical protein